jgi:hypothetical protein
VAAAPNPRDTIGRFEQAGATWWIELCSDTPDEEHARVRALTRRTVVNGGSRL